MKYKVSVLVPIYNVSFFIEKCAHSLFLQTFQNLEYIFVNDGTQDDSIIKLEKVIEKYPNRKSDVKIIHHSSNKGASGARKTAINTCTGNYVSFIDSDDYIEPDMIELLYKEAVKDSADIVVCDFIMEYAYKNEIKVDVIADNQKDNFLLMLKQDNTHCSLCNKLTKRILLIDIINKLPDGFSYAEDRYIMTLMFYYAKSISKINRPLYHYVRFNTLSTTSNKSKIHFENSILLWNLLDEFMNKNDLFDKYLDVIGEQKAQNKIRLMIDTQSSKLRKEYAYLFMDEEKRYFYIYKRVEKIFLLLIRFRLFRLAQYLHNMIVFKQKINPLFKKNRKSILKLSS